MPPAIVAHDLSKRYRICPTIQRPGARTLGDAVSAAVSGAVAAALAAPRAWLGRNPRPEREELWALRDVSLEVQPGETVGLVGRNGAGKSTLLKLFSLITRPTTGRLSIHGRTGSLLELGVGFHAELSGRENVFLTGAMQGLRRTEVARQLDAIIAFSGIEPFLDMPVKRYSSGMLGRLAFAAAAHLDADILMVDEALSVGDAAFQARCAERMTRLAESGRTVLFVSHNLGSLASLCRRGVFLEQGRLVLDAPIEKVVETYTRSLQGSTAGAGSGGAGGSPASPGRDGIGTDRAGQGLARVTGVDVLGDDGRPGGLLTVGRAARFVCRVSARQPGLTCTLVVLTGGGQAVAQFSTRVAGSADRADPAQGPQFVCEVERMLLAPGFYRVMVTLHQGEHMQDHFWGAASFDVLPGDVSGRPVAASRFAAVVLPHRWILPG